MAQSTFVSSQRKNLADVVLGGSSFNLGPHPILDNGILDPVASWAWVPGDPTDGTAYGVVTLTRSGAVKLPFTMLW